MACYIHTLKTWNTSKDLTFKIKCVQAHVYGDIKNYYF